jgi:hypothetical protein
MVYLNFFHFFACLWIRIRKNKYGSGIRIQNTAIIDTFCKTRLAEVKKRKINPHSLPELVHNILELGIGSNRPAKPVKVTVCRTCRYGTYSTGLVVHSCRQNMGLLNEKKGEANGFVKPLPGSMHRNVIQYLWKYYLTPQRTTYS